jgi:hypothetical protein
MVGSARGVACPKRVCVHGGGGGGARGGQSSVCREENFPIFKGLF